MLKRKDIDSGGLSLWKSCLPARACGTSWSESSFSFLRPPFSAPKTMDSNRGFTRKPSINACWGTWAKVMSPGFTRGGCRAARRGDLHFSRPLFLESVTDRHRDESPFWTDGNDVLEQVAAASRELKGSRIVVRDDDTRAGPRHLRARRGDWSPSSARLWLSQDHVALRSSSGAAAR